MNESLLLKAVSITKTFPGVKALDNVHFSLEAGQVHILLGENGAGKSTFIKLLSGAFKMDSGDVYISGQNVEIKGVKHAAQLGIATIYQEMNLIPELTVCQNIFLGKELMKNRGRLDKDEMRKRSVELLNQLDIDLSPDTKISALSVPQQQMVEIAKALSSNAKIIIFDEPTATLAEKEVKALFTVIRKLKNSGIGIVYISHRLEEIDEIGDQVTVFRDGQYVDSLRVSETSIPHLIKLMVGREITDQFPRTETVQEETAFELKGLTKKGVIDNVSLNVKKGEIVGLAGLVGSGRTELAECIFGITPIDHGDIIFNGETVDIRTSLDAVNRGFGFLTEDRKQLGLFLRLSVKENMLYAAMPKLFPKGVVNKAKELEVAYDYVEKLQIKTSNLDKQVQYLSGGNQQKVVFAKWLATKAEFLILDEPTRGVDVGAKREIHRLMNTLVEQGKSILMISSELPEVMGMSDRVYVMRNGRITGELEKSEYSQERILDLAMRG